MQPVPPLMSGAQGWAQFLTNKKKMLNAFDEARSQAKAHEVETFHGNVAEAVFRDWLASFLPKRYAVTSGYVVSQCVSGDVTLPHFDVIVYEHLESPVLWVEGHPGLSPEGRARAIPAEYARAIIEVKASCTRQSAAKAMEQLSALRPLLDGFDPPGQVYKCYLPERFFWATVFFDLKVEHARSLAVLDHLDPGGLPRGFGGGIVLRGEGLPADHAGLICNYLLPSPPDVERHNKDHSLLSGAWGKSRQLPNGRHAGLQMMWCQPAYAMFASGLVAALSGAATQDVAPTLHCLPPSVQVWYARP